MAEIEIRPLRQAELTITVEGLTQLVTHRWPEKARKMIRDKKMGRKDKTREVCDPEQEFEGSIYRLPDGSCGFPAAGLKAAIIGAAHKDLGLTKVDVRQGFFLQDDADGLVRIQSAQPKMREDTVRVGNGQADLRYRAEFAAGWRMVLRVLFDEDKLTASSVINLIERAGFGVGIGEWRPSKGGEWGRFHVVTD